MLWRKPMKCERCGDEIPFIYDPLSAWQRISGFTGDNGGHYAPHQCSDEAMAAWSERMKKEHPELAPAARELAEKIATGDM